MAPLHWLRLGAALAPPRARAATAVARPLPLPTRRTTIEPLNIGLDAAAQHGGRRRQDLDSAAQ